MENVGRPSELNGTGKSAFYGTKKASRKSLAIRRAVNFVIIFLLLFAFWILLSGRFDAFHLTLGLISCALVTYFSGDLLLTSYEEGRIPFYLRFVVYVPWLIYQIFLSSIHMMTLVFHPRPLSRISPRVIRFRSKLTNEIALVTFANSITLTPGTITVTVSVDGEFRVHAIDEFSGDALPGDMERRIAKIFGEESQTVEIFGGE